ncbi:flavodoxin [Neisseria sp.]|uniref:flavodoxin n=1 Tax=Neisseria sp. TaxID=192066 RepID=UPI0026DB77A7|nr:flavodoxin [Neisseria sp.]MDO4228046.1 flavodoxin [Neisseria sp.]
MKHPSPARRRFLQGALALIFAGTVNLPIRAETTHKTLIVYLSRTGNNQALAEFIAQETGGDLARIETLAPYPQNYQAMRNQVLKELADGILPPIKPISHVADYQQIIIVFPTWAMQLPPPVKTFLTTHNLSDKTILPLNTNAGYGVGSGFDEIKRLAVRANVKTGLSLTGGNERDGKPFVMQGETLRQAQAQVRTWLKQP